MHFSTTSVSLRLDRVLETQTVAMFVSETTVSMANVDNQIWIDMRERMAFNNNNAFANDWRVYVYRRVGEVPGNAGQGGGAVKSEARLVESNWNAPRPRGR